MAHRFGLFDVDNREMDAARRALTYRPRVSTIVPQLDQLYALAAAKDYPVVFTTCCSGCMPLPGELPETCCVPLDASHTPWRESGLMGTGCRQFYLAKRTCGHPQANLACRAYDMFQHNPNAVPLLRELNVQTWIVFGNGFDLCVASAARGILQAGLETTLLEDVRISSAGGTVTSEQGTLQSLRQLGARLMTFQEFMYLPDHS